MIFLLSTPSILKPSRLVTDRITWIMPEKDHIGQSFGNLFFLVMDAKEVLILTQTMSYHMEQGTPAGTRCYFTIFQDKSGSRSRGAISTDTLCHRGAYFKRCSLWVMWNSRDRIPWITKTLPLFLSRKTRVRRQDSGCM